MLLKVRRLAVSEQFPMGKKYKLPERPSRPVPLFGLATFKISFRQSIDLAPFLIAPIFRRNQRHPRQPSLSLN